MDPWGDPWADNADADAAASFEQPPKTDVAVGQSQSHTKSQIKEGLPSTSNSLLTGFLDDAQWGNVEPEENAWGEWATTTTEADKDIIRTGDAERESSSELAVPAAVDADADGKWGHSEAEEEEAKSDELENGVSAASESESTVQADEPGEGQPTTSKPDDELSTRTSLSPSEASHTEAATESPRTSYEEERIAGKATENVATVQEEDIHKPELEGKKEDDSEETQVDNEHTVSDHASNPPPEVSETPKLPILATGIDPALFSELFPPSETSKEIPPPPDDPISNIPTRKAWYRLTRKETMREFNSGSDDNNYVRVTWATSQIRVEAAKIVSRWTHDDRISGRGPGGRISFYWDKAPPATHDRQPSTHLRKTSIVSNPSAAQPTMRRPSVATDVPVAFNWSSPTSAQAIWSDDTQHTSNVSPIVARPTSLRTSLETDNGPIPQDSASQGPQMPYNQKRSSIAITPSVISPIVPIPPANNSVPETVENKNGPPAPKTKPDLEPINLATPQDDDDDEWGEMVESPALSPPTPIAPFFQTPNPVGNTRRTPSPAPYIPTPPVIPLSKDATPIVRLQGKLSPTSTVFGAKPLVLGTEERRAIGPQLLRSTKKPQNGHGQTRSVSAPVSSLDEMVETKIEPVESNIDVLGSTSAPTVQAPPSANEKETDNTPAILDPAPETKQFDTQPSLPPSQPSQSPTSSDPWLDADFSVFESAAPAAQPPSQSQSIPSAPASSSIWDMPPPPLPSSTPNSAQRQQAADDETIKSILSGLPDLGYMLRS